MTRGRDANHAYVIVEDNQTALDVLTQAIGRDWIDQPAVARRPSSTRTVTGNFLILVTKTTTPSSKGASSTVSSSAGHEPER